MQLLYARCAGLDVHAREIVACVRVVTGATVEYHQLTVPTTTRGLLAVVDWLTSHHVTHVAMEATGVYWKPVWHITCCATAWNSTISGPITLHTMTSSKWRSDSSGDCATLVSTSK